jgi:ubiquinone/menaquinone biosynthesis C-methylase UbiE
MRWSRETTLRHRPDLSEVLDGLAMDGATLAGNLRDIRRYNRLLGWHRSIAREATRLVVARIPAARPTILDVGCGSGDIGQAVARRLRRGGRAPRLICADLHPPVLAAARRLLGTAGDCAYLCADGLRLPLPDRSVDLVLCSATLHHFSPGGAVPLLAELGRVARGALLVSDLERGRVNHLAARALTTLTTRNPASRHDGVVSVLRAYTRDELSRLAGDAGLAGATVRRRLPGRLALAWCPPPS